MHEHRWHRFGRGEEQLRGSVLNLWAGGLLSSGYAEDTRAGLPIALPAPACPSWLLLPSHKSSQSSQLTDAVCIHPLPGKG